MLLVVDAFDGPMPQTRFVLRKALALGRTPIVVINKIDRPGADPMRVHDEVLDLFIELEADEAQLDAPVVYASAREGVATMDLDVPAVDLTPLFDAIIEHVPPPTGNEAEPFQMLVSTIDHSPYLGRLAIGRIERGTVHVGDQVALLPLDPTQPSERSRVTKLYTFEGLERVEVPSAEAGEIVALAGLEGVEIGLTLTDLEHAERLEGIAVEEPTISVDFLVNNSPFAGRDGKFVTSRQVRERLYRGAGAKRGAPGGRHRLHGHVDRLGPRRAASLDPDGDHAPRGVRVPGLPSPGHHQARCRAGSGWSRTRSCRSTCPRSTWAWSSRSWGRAGRRCWR